MRWFLLGFCLALSACERSPSTASGAPTETADLPDATQAEQAARQHAGDAETRGFWIAADAELAELAKLGLVEFTPGDHSDPFELEPRKLSLTAEGEKLGLKVEIPSADWPFGPTGVRAERLCENGFGAVATITALSGGPLPAASVVYQRRNTGQSPLYQRLAGTSLETLKYCDPAASEDRNLVMVRRASGWALNRPPEVAGEPSAKTEYSYDDAGRRIGAVSQLTLGKPQVTDADGDATVFIGWTAQELYPGDAEGDSAEFRDAKLDVNGEAAVFTHNIFMGERSGGVVRYVVRDPWEEGHFRFCIEGYRFGC
ncbi:MAG TPA: hypothetical protein VFG21_11610 [Xanthomonadaceae bacterium]|nr:hypothetical protein [Xanthomonadaceae bacterium]